MVGMVKRKGKRFLKNFLQLDGYVVDFFERYADFRIRHPRSPQIAEWDRAALEIARITRSTEEEMHIYCDRSKFPEVWRAKDWLKAGEEARKADEKKKEKADARRDRRQRRG
jgi:hypothetical protein